MAYSVSLLVVVGALSTCGILRLLESKSALIAASGCDAKMLDYGTVANSACGKPGRAAVNTSLLLAQFGFCVVYVSMAGTTMASLSALMSKYCWMVLFTISVTPGTFVKELDSFRFTNVLGMVIVVVTVCVVFVFDGLELDRTSADERSVGYGINDNYMLFFGTATYTFEGIGLILPIQLRMEEPHRMGRACMICMLMMTVGFVLFGALSYIAYGEATEAIILLNLEGTCESSACVRFIQSLRGIYVVVLLVTFPLMMYPVTQLSERFVFSHIQFTPLRSLGWRTVLCMLSLAISIGAAKNLSNFVSIIGALCCVPLAYVLPGLLHLQLVVRGVAKDPAVVAMLVELKELSADDQDDGQNAELSDTQMKTDKPPDEAIAGFGQTPIQWTWCQASLDCVLIMGGACAGVICMYEAIRSF